MHTGQNLGDAIGPTAGMIFSNPDSKLAGAINTIMPSETAFHAMPDGKIATAGTPVGNGLNEYLGGQGEFGNLSGDKHSPFGMFAKNTLMPLAGLGVIKSVLDWSHNDENRREAQQAQFAQEELRKAEMAKEDAQRQQAILAEDRRKMGLSAPSMNS